MDDDFYSFHTLSDERSPAYNPEPISLQFYNNPAVSFSAEQFRDDDAASVMVQQINEDGKDWSEEDISDLESLQTDFKNDRLPTPSTIRGQALSDAPRSHAHTRNKHSHHRQHNGKAGHGGGPHYVNVTDLINKIGFGRFHYQLIFLCGLGYVADSMWSEAITLIITPVQNEWNIENRHLGWLAATLFSGMCVGSFVWGRTSDVVGRKFPFTLPLSIGFGVGGNIPVDGAILAEFLPTSHRGSIMVSLSIFWALGDLVSAFLAFLIIPDRICHDKLHCEAEQNMGWRYLIFA